MILNINPRFIRKNLNLVSILIMHTLYLPCLSHSPNMPVRVLLSLAARQKNTTTFNQSRP